MSQPNPPPPPSTPPSGGWQSPDYYVGTQVDRDAEHLKILSICWTIVGCLLTVLGCIPIIHVVLGLVVMALSQSGGPQAPPLIMGGLFFCIGTVAVLTIWTFATFSFITARSLKSRRRIILCYVVAALACLQVPFGVTLGVFTFVVLARPSIKATFT